MNNWMISLKGNSEDIKFWIENFNINEISIIERDNKFYLKSSKFNSLDDISKILKYGRNIITCFNAITDMYKEDYKPVIAEYVARFLEDDRNGIEVVTNVDICVKIRNERPKNVKEECLLLATSVINDSYIADAISFFYDSTWVSLYKLFELIRDDIGNKRTLVAYGWVSNTDLNRFTQTAQSREALGNESRHASKKYKPPSNPMNIGEANEIFRNILIQWVKLKTYDKTIVK